MRSDSGNGKIVIDGSSTHRILLQLHHLHFVLAAARRLFHLHTALAALFILTMPNIPRRELVHAIVQVHRKTGAYRKVSQEHYGGECFFHELYKDRL
ncbi:MAG: hypothetical protein JWP69_1958 [Flaviaesturariibacter sp.]|nr:hypothetical protein [Flaviaesturariibacter sp.]